MNTGKIYCHSKYVEWKFGDFTSQLKKEGNIIRSPNFSFDGVSFCLEIYPHARAGDSGWISVYLVNVSDLRIYISASIGIKKDDGTVYVSHEFNRRKFNANSWFSGFEDFVQRSSLWIDMPVIAPNDKVTFFCSISSTDESCQKAKTQTLELEGICKLSQDFKDLYTSRKDCDTTIKIANREFQAHRLILGVRSPVFASMYRHDTTERNTGIVEIEDCDPDAFEDLLIFLYSGNVESVSSTNALNLYAVADKYDVQEVKLKCLKFMLSNLSVENFCDIIVLALKYNESELLKATSDFFVKNVKKISVTPGWFCFHRDYPVEANELCIKAFKIYAPD